MPIHDAYGRVTPYELLLPKEGFAETRFTAIAEEAEERGADLEDPEAFPLLSEVGMVLRELRPEGDDPQLLTQYGTILFHAFHFWREGQPLFYLDVGVVRYLVDTGPGEGSWNPVLPCRAGYAQLPQHLIWTAGGEEDAPESLDGFFWSAPKEGELNLLVVMGMRKDRPGLSVVPLPPLPLVAAGSWVSAQVRSGGEDFSSTLPGADLENLYSVEAGAEVVKLAMRAFWYLDAFPGSVAGEESAPGSEDRTSGTPAAGPQPTALPYRRVVLGDR